ncbi:RNA polymerase sigma factor SigI [Paraliobacillus sp. PM-2]|uniref:RNA polymerase sigma-I factor n=1 Tax=Paraliobacillus sp. PM-2 TaxID=1462524 RepID=UPI00061BF09F|nr:RNA polymerase sigma-I factor [Paraliobacillus sp. PM-2]CQR47087.1 RNA polymerase sigma factor SigI [Paraliobacillus sp. PM-2]
MGNQLAIEMDSLENIVYEVQLGNRALQNELLQAYKPYIAKCVSEVCKRYIDPTKDDEFSIGLFAFYEAINCYSKDKGSSFLSFARLVIKRKTIDYIRKEKTNSVVISLDKVYEQEKSINPLEIAAANKAYQVQQDNWNRRQEILLLSKQLQSYQLSMKELVNVSPKHKDARKNAIGIAYLLYKDVEMRAFVQKKKKLPMKELAKKVEVSKKTLERNRKYILAIFIMLDGEFFYLQEFIKEQVDLNFST